MEMTGPAPTIAATTKPDRLVSLDAYRGLTMLLMASEGLGLAEVAKHFPDDRWWQAVGFHVSHVAWQGCSLWDLIQPSFMFMVGVAAAYSFASRRAAGQSYGRMAWHALVRSAILVLLGVFLRSRNFTETNFTFEDVITQIGLGYFFLFMLCGRTPRAQWVWAFLILASYWLLFFAYSPPPSVDNAAAYGLPPDWEHLEGTAAHWDKNTNAAAAVDRWLLNRFPRSILFHFNKGGYQTLNFIPSLATMICGLLAGGWLRGPASGRQKFLALAGMGLLGIGAGYVWQMTGTCPMVKRIWTPSWTIYAAGWTSLLLAGFYGVIDLAGWRRWTFPLVVVGMNSITMYVMAVMLSDWIAGRWRVHGGPGIFHFAGDIYEPLVKHAAILLTLWLICYGLYRQRIFIRV
jgi:heparan-alpha-glucosaminide N-acetyltransferase